jgi:AAA domain
VEIKTASRTRAKLRVGLFGASGSGKTYSSLKMAHGLTDAWEKIIVIDTERESANLYSHLGPYGVLQLEPPFEPERYINAITACERAGAEVIIIDSISHEWIGKGGCLELVEKVAGNNSYTKWKDITPRHNAFIDRILQCRAHVICCGRSKDDVDLIKNDKGKMEPQKVGLKAVTRDGFDYEMTVCFDLDKWHQALCSKDRTQLFDGKPGFEIDETTGEKMLAWMNSAPEAPKPIPTAEPTTDPRKALQQEIDRERQAKGMDWPQVWGAVGMTLTGESSINDLQEVLRRLLTS